MSQYETLFFQMQSELSKLEHAVQTDNKLIAALETVEENSDAYEGIVGGIAMNLQSAYTGIERTLLAISKQIDNTVPKGAQWHQSLLTQMIEKTDGRPAVLSENTVQVLRPLLGFRHVVRNAYSYTLDVGKVLENANRLSTCFTNFAYDCLALQCALTNPAPIEDQNRSEEA